MKFASLVGNLVACLAVAFWLNVFQLKSAKLKFHQSRCSGLLGVEVTSQGLQYFLKRYLSGPVVLTLVDFCTSRGRMTVSDIGLRLRSFV